eukprot:m51a1_g7531 putative ricin b lectin (943) ;mRNA; r:41555-45847
MVSSPYHLPRAVRFGTLACACLVTLGSYFIYDFPGAIGNVATERWFSVSTVQYELLYSMYAWPNTVLAFFGGVLVDRVLGVGLGAVLFSGVVTLGQLVFAIGVYRHCFHTALAGRLVYGLAGDSLVVVQSAAVASQFRGRELSLATLRTLRFPPVVWMTFPAMVTFYISVSTFMTIGRDFFTAKYYVTPDEASTIMGLPYTTGALLCPIIGILVDYFSHLLLWPLLSTSLMVVSYMLFIYTSLSPLMMKDSGNYESAIFFLCNSSSTTNTRTITPFRSKFEHPGIIWTRSQLDVLRDKPWKDWYNARSSARWYNMRGPFPVVGRNPDLRRNEYFKDMYNVGSLAFIWYVEKDWNAAEKAITILSRWAKTHTWWSGVETPFLAADSMDGIIGADILYGTYPNYTAERHTLIRGYFDHMWGWLTSVGFAPLCAGHRTGAGSHLWGANQGTLQLQVSMATAVFTDNFLLFDETVSAMLTDPIGGLLDTLPSGQVGDTGRDNGHAANQFGYMVWVAEVAWIQGVDVFSALNNRLLAESEYSAQRQLHGFGISGVPEVPFSVFGSGYSMWGGLPGFDNVVRHLDYMSTAYTLYTSRRLAMPFTKMYLDHNKFAPLRTIDTRRPTVVPNGPFVEPAAVPARLESSLSVAAMGTLWRSGSGKFLGDGKWVLSAGGGDGGWETCKGLVFAYKQFDGDATFIAQVLTGGGEVRLIDRLQATPNARQVRMFLSPGLYSNFWRGACSSYAVSREHNTNLGLPAWAKIVRRGNFVYAYSSPDGKSWCPQSNLVLDNLGKTVFIGLSVISGNATFANVMYGEAPLSRPDAPATVRVVRSPRGPNGAAITLAWDRNDKAVYYYVWRADNSTGPFTIVAPRVLANQYTDVDVKARKTYWYKVQCAGYSGDSPNESPVIQATAALPGLVMSASPRAPMLSVVSLVLLVAAAIGVASAP